MSSFFRDETPQARQTGPITIRPRRTEYILRGGLVGEMWMGGTGYLHDQSWTLDRDEHRPFAIYLDGFRDTLDQILMRDGGDFNGAQFAADTELEVRRVYESPDGRRVRTHIHWLQLAECPSVADMVSEHYSFDWE